MAQLVINRLPLPEEINSIIKDYVFPSQERKIIMDLKQNICNIIKDFSKNKFHTYSYNNLDNSYSLYNLKSPAFHMALCNKCGDYKNRHRYNKIVCKCR